MTKKLAAMDDSDRRTQMKGPTNMNIRMSPGQRWCAPALQRSRRWTRRRAGVGRVRIEDRIRRGLGRRVEARTRTSNGSSPTAPVEALTSTPVASSRPCRRPKRFRTESTWSSATCRRCHRASPRRTPPSRTVTPSPSCRCRRRPLCRSRTPIWRSGTPRSSRCSAASTRTPTWFMSRPIRPTRRSRT